MSHRHIGVTLFFVIALFVALAAPAAAQVDEPGKLVIGGQYTLASGQQLVGDLGVIGGQATIEDGAIVRGDILVAGGVLTVAGRVNGDIVVFGGSVTLERTATVTGDLVTFGGSVERSPGAVVNGEMREGGEFDMPVLPGPLPLPGTETFTPDRGALDQQSPGAWLLAALWSAIRTGIVVLALAALALIVTLLWPRGIERLGKTVLLQPIPVVLVGLLSWVIGLGLFVVLAITICLLPVALAVALALLVAVLLSWVVAGWLVGRSLFSLLKLRSATVVAEATVGTLLLALVYFLVGILPCTEFIVGTLIVSLGLGAIVLTRFGTRPYPFVPAVVENSLPGATSDELAIVPVEDQARPPQVSDQ